MATSSDSSILYTPSVTTATSTIYTSSTSTSDSFQFPPYASFPPFYTLQPNQQTRARQLELWSSLITSYSTHHRLFRLSLTIPPPDLFTNKSLSRSLSPTAIRAVLDWMAQPSNGGRIEYLLAAAKGQQSDSCYVWWRSAGEWADLMYAWVEETGQKGGVLTVYELREGEGREWKEMDEGMLRKVLAVLVKRGRAQVFGEKEGEGVKFF
jgi:ESCRT-II complex subunit VPS25